MGNKSLHTYLHTYLLAWMLIYLHEYMHMYTLTCLPTYPHADTASTAHSSNTYWFVTWSPNYLPKQFLMWWRQERPTPDATYLQTYSHTSLLPYLHNYVHAYLLTCLLQLTCWRREQHASTFTYLHDCVLTNLLTYYWLTLRATPTFTLPCDIAYLLTYLLPTLPADADTRP